MNREEFLAQQNAELTQALNNTRGQVNFLENRLREVMPKSPLPQYPSMDMPVTPKIEGDTVPDSQVRATGEGQMEMLPDPTQSPVLPPPDGKMRIMIGVPLLAVSYEFFESFLRFWTQLCVNRDPRYEITYHFAYRKPVHMAEEYLVKVAQHNRCTHLLMMDDDIYDITVADLNKLIDAKKEFISGVMHASKFPHAMCTFRRYDRTKRVIDMPSDTSMYRLYEIPASCPKCNAAQSHWDVRFCISCGEDIDISIQPVDLVPFPFTLFDLKIFDKVKKPWFHCTNEYPTDSWFCDRLLEAGIQPYAHMCVRLNHAGVTDATKPHFIQMGMARMHATKAIVQLSPEQMDIHQTLLLSRMKAVEEQIKAKPPVIADGSVVANEAKADYTLVTAQAR